MSGQVMNELVPSQERVFKKLSNRIMDTMPSILWAGAFAGKTLICQKLSQHFQGLPQVAIGYHADEFIGYAIDEYDFGKPSEFPLSAGLESEGMWSQITPTTLVFIDDVFAIRNGERLYNRLKQLTPHIVAMGCKGHDLPEWTNNYFLEYVGPYSTWELNPYMDENLMRASRPKGSREPFNSQHAVCVGDWDTKWPWIGND